MLSARTSDDRCSDDPGRNLPRPPANGEWASERCSRAVATVVCRTTSRRREVPAHHVVAAHNPLAHRLGVLRDVVHVLVNDPNQVGRGVGLALTREQLRPLLERQLLALLDRTYRDRAVGLG